MQTRCHLSVLPHEQAKKYGDKVVMNYREFGSVKWSQLTWNEFSHVTRDSPLSHQVQRDIFFAN